MNLRLLPYPAFPNRWAVLISLLLVPFTFGMGFWFASVLKMPLANLNPGRPVWWLLALAPPSIVNSLLAFWGFPKKTVHNFFSRLFWLLLATFWGFCFWGLLAFIIGLGEPMATG